MLYLAAFGGFVLLFAGGELLVRGAVSVARRAGVSKLLIGMTVVAAGTSAPELLVSLRAAGVGQPDIAIGNVVGSNIANILLILGAAAVLSPMAVDVREIRREVWVLLAASVGLVGVVHDRLISGVEGAVMAGLLVAYVIWSYWLEVYRSSPVAELHVHEAEEFAGVTDRLAFGLLYLVLGLGMLVGGSELLIVGATGIARTLGIPEAVVGLSIVAIGTSLPELATSITAALRGHSDVAVGNVVGSNIFNVMLILGATALVQPIPVSEAMASTDVLVALGTAVLLAPLLLVRGSIGRVAGVVFLGLYAGYIGWLYLG
jgi:cation:H+ antiporter